MHVVTILATRVLANLYNGQVYVWNYNDQVWDVHDHYEWRPPALPRPWSSPLR